MGVEVNNAHRIVSSNWNSIRTDGNFDTENDQANMAHVESSSLKLCLKSKILSRRRQRGLNDIHVDFTPRQSYPMTAEEKEKDEKRRQSNRISARKCRIKQRKQWERNEKILLQLESEHDLLRNKLSEIEAEKSAVMTALKDSIPASRIKEFLAEKIDYNVFNKYPENVKHRSGDILEEIEACDGTGETGGSVTRFLEESEMPILEDLQLSNDCFVQSEFLTKYVTEENTTEDYEINVVNVLDTVNNSFIFNSVDNHI